MKDTAYLGVSSNPFLGATCNGRNIAVFSILVTLVDLDLYSI